MAFNVQKVKKKSFSREELEEFSKEELINRIVQLETHNSQLKNILEKHLTETGGKSTGVNKFGKRPFDFTKHTRRHVLLKVCYLGWDYQGLVTQEHTTRTIEHYFFEALVKSCLVENRQTCNYHRCGRTDKGVSAFCQTFSMDLRSCLPQDKIDSGVTEGELPYTKILNTLLPDDIMVLSWIPVRADFSARFDCVARTYKYFFPRGNLDIAVMDEAAQHLVGTHDFRNFCKLDVKNGVVNYMRSISLAKVCLRYSDPLGHSGYDLCELTVCGKAFLWHQIRCIVGVLVLVGQKKESPDVVKSLLSVEETPCKPQYNLAAELPLILFYCEYEDINDSVEVRDSAAFEMSLRNLQTVWSKHALQAGMVRSMLDELEKSSADIFAQADWLLQGVKSRVYQPLKKRQMCESLEERIEFFKKKQKLSTSVEESL